MTENKTKILSVLLFSAAILLSILSIWILKGNNNESEHISNGGKGVPLTSVAFEESREDLGILVNDTTVWRSFVFKNIGNDSLHVLFIDPDCNCTSYHLSSNSVAIGDSIQVDIEIDMREKNVGKFMLNTVVGLNTERKLYNICIEGEITGSK